MLDVFATGSYREVCTDTLPNLKPVVTAAAGAPIRRIDRFIQLAVIGACRCATNISLPQDTAVFMGSEYGELETPITVMQSMYIKRMPPKPFDFINTVSNAACFYVAQQLKLAGASNFVGRKHSAFTATLQLAMADILFGSTKCAMLGMVEAAVEPLTEHRNRLQLGDDQQLIEYSHWFFVAAHGASQFRPALATVSMIKSFTNSTKLTGWLEKQDIEYVAYSGMDSAEVKQQLQACNAQTWTHSAAELSAVLQSFITEPGPRNVCVVNQGLDGSSTALIISRP